MVHTKPIPSHSPLRYRIEASVLLSAIFVGCQLLWLAVPVLSFWGLSRFVSSASGYLLLSVVLVPFALAAFVALLGLANRRYLAISTPPPEDDEEVRLHGPLESMLPASIVLAIVALLLWIALFANQMSLALE